MTLTDVMQSWKLGFMADMTAVGASKETFLFNKPTVHRGAFCCRAFPDFAKRECLISATILLYCFRKWSHNDTNRKTQSWKLEFMADMTAVGASKEIF